MPIKVLFYFHNERGELIHMNEQKYNEITLEKIEEYQSKGYIVVCDADYLVVSITKES